MRRDQLEHAIRTACQIIGQEEVIIIGSQAILGSYREDELPPAATMSLEVDVLPIAESNGRAIELADQIEGVAGEWSRFEQTHGYRIDGVDLERQSCRRVGELAWCAFRTPTRLGPARDRRSSDGV